MYPFPGTGNINCCWLTADPSLGCPLPPQGTASFRLHSLLAVATANDYLMQEHRSPTPFSQFGTFLKGHPSCRAPCSIIWGLTELYFMLASPSGQSCFPPFLTGMSPKTFLSKLCACTSPSQSVSRKPRLRYILGAEGAEALEPGVGAVCSSLRCGGMQLPSGTWGQSRGRRDTQTSLSSHPPTPFLPCHSLDRPNWKPASKGV